MDSYTRQRQWVARVEELTEALTDESNAFRESHSRPTKQDAAAVERSTRWLKQAAHALIGSIVALGEPSRPIDLAPEEGVHRTVRGARDRSGGA